MSSFGLSEIRDAPLGSLYLPEPVRHVFPRHLLQGWLRLLCRELDLRLHAPVTVSQAGAKRIVTVFRVIEYTVDRDRRSVSCRAARSGGRGTVVVDLWRPIRTGFWMPWFMADMGLWRPRGPQVDLFESERLACRDWLARTAFRLLRRDPRFRLLCEKRVPEALNLDRDLVQIALRSRTSLRGYPLWSTLYTLVWRNEGAFRQVARENPQLLPLLRAYLDDHKMPAGKDPVQALKSHLRNEGVPEAAWRYLCRHGARIFRGLWEATPDIRPLGIASLYLLRLHQMGLPPAPPAAVVRVWAAQADLYDLFYLDEFWDQDLCALYRIAFSRAAQVKGTPGFDRFLDEFTAVVAWAEPAGLSLDRNQRRAGWPLLVRRAQQARGEAESPARLQPWTSLVPEFELGKYRIVPLTSEGELVAEGRAMRNCIAVYAGIAGANAVRLFSIRARSSGRLRADLMIRYAPEQRHWVQTQLAGPANRSVAREIEPVAAEVARRYNEAQARSPLPSAPRFAQTDDGTQREVDQALADLAAWYEALREAHAPAA